MWNIAGCVHVAIGFGIATSVDILLCFPILSTVYSAMYSFFYSFPSSPVP
jgi:hypothetical protein